MQSSLPVRYITREEKLVLLLDRIHGPMRKPSNATSSGAFKSPAVPVSALPPMASQTVRMICPHDQ